MHLDNHIPALNFLLAFKALDLHGCQNWIQGPLERDKRQGLGVCVHLQENFRDRSAVTVAGHDNV